MLELTLVETLQFTGITSNLFCSSLIFFLDFSDFLLFLALFDFYFFVSIEFDELKLELDEPLLKEVVDNELEDEILRVFFP